MRLKLLTDGTKEGTKIVHAETGEVLQKISSFTFTMDWENRKSAKLTVTVPDLDLSFDNEAAKEIRDEERKRKTFVSLPFE